MSTGSTMARVEFKHFGLVKLGTPRMLQGLQTHRQAIPALLWTMTDSTTKIAPLPSYPSYQTPQIQSSGPRPPASYESLPTELMLLIRSRCIVPRRVWLRHSSYCTPAGVRSGCSANAPFPLIWCIDHSTRDIAQEWFGYIELKSHASDPKGIVFSLSNDMVFITYSHIHPELKGFRDTMKEQGFLGGLRCIAVDVNIIQKHVDILQHGARCPHAQALREEKIRILKDFHGLEPIFIFTAERLGTKTRKKACRWR